MYLAQTPFDTLMNTLRGDPAFGRLRSNVYALTPDTTPDAQPTTLDAIRLMKVGSTDLSHPAQKLFQEALVYAESSGGKNYEEFLLGWKRTLSKLLGEDKYGDSL